MKITAQTYQNQGKRKIQQDVLYHSPNGQLSILCDGIGSNLMSGNFAEHIISSIKNSDSNGLVIASEKELTKILVNAVNEYKEKFEGKIDFKNLGCTLAMVIVFENQIFTVHLGDSRILIFSDEEVIYSSTPHNLGEVIKNNMDEHAADQLELRIKNQLVRAVCLDTSLIIPEVNQFDLTSPIAYCMMATDGVFEANVKLPEMFQNVSKKSALKVLESKIKEESIDNSSYIFLSLKKSHNVNLESFLFYLIVVSTVFCGFVYLWYFFVK